MSTSIGIRFKEIITKYPLLRGVLSYSIIWPASALIQQRIAGKTWGSFFYVHMYMLFYKFKSNPQLIHLII